MSLKFSEHSVSNIINCIYDYSAHLTKDEITKITSDPYYCFKSKYIPNLYTLFESLVMLEKTNTNKNKDITIEQADSLMFGNDYVQLLRDGMIDKVKSVLPNSYFELNNYTSYPFFKDDTDQWDANKIAIHTSFFDTTSIYKEEKSYEIVYKIPPFMGDIIIWVYFTWVYRMYLLNPQEFQSKLDTGKLHFTNITLTRYSYLYYDSISDPYGKCKYELLRKVYYNKILASIISFVETYKIMFPELYIDLFNLSTKIDFSNIIVETIYFSNFQNEMYYNSTEDIYITYCIKSVNYNDRSLENNIGKVYDEIGSISEQLKSICVEFISKYKNTVSRYVSNKLLLYLDEIKYSELNPIIYNKIKEDNVITMSNIKNVMTEVITYLKEHHGANIDVIKISSPSGNYTYTGTDNSDDSRVVLNELKTLINYYDDTICNKSSNSDSTANSNPNVNSDPNVANDPISKGCKKEVINGVEHYFKLKKTRSGKNMWCPSTKEEYESLSKDISIPTTDNIKISQELFNGLFQNTPLYKRTSNLLNGMTIADAKNDKDTSANGKEDTSSIDDFFSFLEDTCEEGFHYERQSDGTIQPVRNQTENEA